ncbi:Methyltransferase fsdD [Pseudocercospora fuligena]|uniref:Methyltransferase fsdD n=1 Tax=Pseudocercospora fuligena TaxID=685502 RepID=A0A8H6RMP3_9PEZI|nr:Methyltransferase fsdD [Pseudocercospora fuligena]
MSNKVLHAPIETSATGLRLLDIGCGTGIVTDLMSSTFPHAECIGLDVSKVPKIRAHNSNVKFFQGNVMGQKPTEWIGEEKKRLEKDEELFDYLFSRLLILGMSDWPSFLKKEYELLKPGGWVEVQDLAWDWFSPDGVAISDEWEWLRWLSDHFETKKGIDVHCGNKAEKWMKDAGFEDVQVIKYVFPFCGSSESTLEMREFGRFNAEAVPVMLHHAIEKAVIDGESPVTEELHRKIEEMRSEMKRTLVPGKGMYQIFSVAIGRKPE